MDNPFLKEKYVDIDVLALEAKDLAYINGLYK